MQGSRQTSGRGARASSPLDPGSRSEWTHLKGGRLKDYLSEVKKLRDLLSHGKDPVRVTNDGRTLWEVRGGWSLRLMGVEGFIQFGEDLAEQALLEAGVPLERVPTWPEPQRSGISLARLRRASAGLSACGDRRAGARSTGSSGS
jgi:hypothetical protein